MELAGSFAGGARPETVALMLISDLRVRVKPGGSIFFGHGVSYAGSCPGDERERDLTNGSPQLIAYLFGKRFRLRAGLVRIEQAEMLQMETCIYGEPMLIPMELTQGREAWIDYPASAQSLALPERVRVLIGGGGLFDVKGNLCGPFDSWDDIHQLAAEVANNWYDRGNG